MRNNVEQLSEKDRKNLIIGKKRKVLKMKRKER